LSKTGFLMNYRTRFQMIGLERPEIVPRDWLLDGKSESVNS
jgi:hypothetical protein